MKYKLKSTFVIHKGTIVTEEIKKWIEKHCDKYPEQKCDLPDGFEALFGGFEKSR